ncbi:hypothetical protein Dimus_011932 [Dionaea muscipula]
MAKRGKPRKTGGLLRSNSTSRAPGKGSVGARKERIEADQEANKATSGGRLVEKLTPDGLGVTWVDEEGELIENEIVVDPSAGPMAGNKDLSKGEQLSQRSRWDEKIVITREAILEELDFWANVFVIV